MTIRQPHMLGNREVRDRAFDAYRLAALLQRIASHFEAGAGVDENLLHRIAWLCDATAFLRTGRSITGATYVRGPQGPLVGGGSGTNTMPGKAWKSGATAAENGNFSGDLRESDSSLLSDEEIRIIDGWVGEISPLPEAWYNRGWRSAEPDEPLPFHVLLSGRVGKPEAGEMDWARGRARELGLP